MLVYNAPDFRNDFKADQELFSFFSICSGCHARPSPEGMVESTLLGKP